MTKEEMTNVDYENLVNSILSIMMKKGILSTTMDQLASTLRISKRTLYEIFISKDNLVGEVLRAYTEYHTSNQIKIAEKASNIIEAMLKIFIFSRDILSEINLDFYRDMEQFYTQIKDFEVTSIPYNSHLLELIKEGITKGYVRTDIDYLLLFRLMLIQMNFLKQMDKAFPRDITMFDVYDTICLGFMRGITSPDGMKILDKLLTEHPELVRMPQLV